MSSPNNFCVFILTHGRPDKVITFNTLKKGGYTGPIFLVVDNEDDCWNEYVQKFGAENVIFFDKRETAKTFDEFDNFDDRRAIVYARNECFQIARKLGYKWFLELDDDYIDFRFRYYGPLRNMPKTKSSSYLPINKVLNGAFDLTARLTAQTGAAAIAFCQGGDWMDGTGEGFNQRKCMNTFFCSTDKPFRFVGRINEDVNTYTWVQSRGMLFLTIAFIQMTQKQTQKTSGGMSDIYLNQGTFVKSFYTIMCSPSCVKIKIMGSTNRRMHHKINWNTAVPMLISERHCKVIKPKPLTSPQPKVKQMTVAEINALVEMPEPRIKPATEKTRRQDAPEPVMPAKEFDQDYWKQQGFSGGKEKWDLQNL